MESHLKFPRDPAALSTVSAILKEVRVSDVPPPRLAMKPPLLPLVIFSDFELDDLMAIAELWQWRAVHMGAPEDARPIIVFITDFKTKDGGEVFEKKLLMARMLLGVTLQDIYTLVCPPGTGNVNWTYFDKKVHPAAPQLYRRKDEILAAAAQDIVDVALSDSNEVVDVYFISPGRGLFGELLQGIERDHPKGWEALCQKANVVMYTGSFNTQGCTLRKEEAAPGPFDYDYIGKLCTVRPLVDISKFVFFGREKGHPVTASADSFASPTLAQSLAERSDLLAACIHAFVDEFQGNLVKPANLSLFRGSELSQEEWDHFKEDIAPPAEVDMQQYAAKLANDALFQKVPNYKKTTVKAFEVGSCDAPLCDQVCFVYKWCCHSCSEELEAFEGNWWLNTKNGFSGVADVIPPDCHDHGIRAIQPYMKDPQNLELLNRMRSALERLVVYHLSMIQPARTAADVIGEGT